LEGSVSIQENSSWSRTTAKAEDEDDDEDDDERPFIPSSEF
jgi:hypothetical protein